MGKQINTTNEEINLKRIVRLPLFRVVCLAILIVLLIIAVASVITGNRKQKDMPSSSDYFYPVSTESVLDMQNYSDGIAVLQTNSLCYLDDGGNLIAQNDHKYANPALRTAGNYALLFDRGANTYRIERNALSGGEVTVSSGLINADICDSGVYGYLLNADAGYQSHFFVFSAKDEKLFEWGSASDYATIVKIAANGKRAAVVTFGVENAEPYSKIFNFDFSNNKEVFSVKLSNTTVFAVKYLTANEIAVFSDNGVYKIKKDGSYETVRAYSSKELNCASVHEAKLSALALNLYGNEHNVQTVIFDRRLHKQAEISCDEKISAVDSDKKHVAIGCGSSVRIADLRGSVRTIKLAETCTQCLLRNNFVYALTPGGIVVNSIFAGETIKE